MRILHLLSQVELTGAEVYAITLAEWQKSKGYEVYIISDELHKKTDISFTKMDVHRTNMWTRGKSRKKLYDFIIANKIDIIHAHSRAAVRIAYPCAKRTKRALVTTLHGKPHRSWSKKLFDVYGDKVISICDNLTYDLHLNLKIDGSKIATLPNPIDLSKINFSNANKSNEKNSTYKVGLIGRTSGPKGVRTTDFLIHVFPHLLEKFPHLHLEIIGGSIDNLPKEGQEQFHKLKSLYKDRVQNIIHIPSLEFQLKYYHLVIGAGRVAIASLASKIPLFAVGEYSSLGLINSKNYDSAKLSNFGDIHHEDLYKDTDYKDALSQLESVIGQTDYFSPDELDSLSECAKNDYSLEVIAPQVIDIYKSARFKKLYPKWIPILMYHKVTDHNLNSKHRIFVTKNTFEKHLRFYKRKGFETLSFSDLKDFRDLKKDFKFFPKKPLIITFDDGYVNNLENAVPLLNKYNFKACFFLLADTSVQFNEWDKADGTPQLPLMNYRQRAELAGLNQEVGSHGFCHKKLSEMSQQDTLKELKESKSQLEHEFKTEILVYAYTYGIKNDFAESAAKKSGYTYAVNTSTGGLHIEDNPLSIFRVSIFPEDGFIALSKKTHSLYRKYYYFKRHQ